MTRAVISTDTARPPVGGRIALPSARLAPWRLAGMVAVALLTAYAFAPSGWPQAIIYQVAGLLPVAAIGWSLRVHRIPRPLPWALIAAGQLAFAAGDAIWTHHELVLGVSPFPSIGDVAYLAAYPLIALAGLLLVRERQPGTEQPRLIDAAIIAVGFGIVTWMVLIQPIALDPTLSPLARVVSIAYPVMDVLLIGLLARLAIAPSAGSTWLRLLIASLALMLVGDVAFSIASANGTYASGDPIDLLWLASYGAMAMAALHPSVVAPIRPAPMVESGLSARRLGLLGVASLAGPAILLGDVTLAAGDVPLGMATLLVTGLVLLRLAGMTATLRRSELRFRSLVQNASDVTVILAADGTNLYQSPAVTNVLGHRPDELVGRDGLDLVHPDDAPHVRRLLAEVQAAPDRQHGADLRLRRADGSWCHVEAVARNMLHDVGVGGIVVNYRDVTQRHALEEQLKHQAFHDSLTGLANRALFTDRLQNAIDRRSRRIGPQAPLAVLFLDLDDFKAVNDGLGHAAGDELLAAIAERLGGCLRAGDTAARVGGDEFAVLLDERVTVRVAEGVARRILDALREPFAVSGRRMAMRASIGIAVSGLDSDTTADDADTVLRNADVAMYQAKLAGRGRYEIFASSMHGAAIARLQLRSDLEHALDRGELEVVYQPIIELATGQQAGVESLLRWNHAEQGTLVPTTFLAAAEETGLVVPIGRWVLETACRQAVAWRERGAWQTAGGAQRLVTVNLSVAQLRDATLVERVRRALVEHQLPPGALVLEITESALLDDTEDRIAQLHALKELGVALAIDDFGTGYSSFSYLRRLPIDILKLDRSFVANVDTRADDRIVANAILDLGRTLGMRVIAEGIETAAQRDVLAELGCELGQGFLFGRPAAAHEATRRLLD